MSLTGKLIVSGLGLSMVAILGASLAFPLICIQHPSVGLLPITWSTISFNLNENFSQENLKEFFQAIPGFLRPNIDDIQNAGHLEIPTPAAVLVLFSYYAIFALLFTILPLVLKTRFFKPLVVFFALIHMSASAALPIFFCCFSNFINSLKGTDDNLKDITFNIGDSGYMLAGVAACDFLYIFLYCLLLKAPRKAYFENSI